MRRSFDDGKLSRTVDIEGRRAEPAESNQKRPLPDDRDFPRNFRSRL